jgi:tetratricopeptide (TPR) repeat protein
MSNAAHTSGNNAQFCKLINLATLTMHKVESARMQAGRGLPVEDDLKLCQQAIINYKEALSIPGIKVDNVILASIYRNMSIAHDYLEEWDQAITFCQKAIDINPKSTDHKRLATSCMERAKKTYVSGNINLSIEDYKNAAPQWDLYLSQDPNATKQCYLDAVQVYTVLGNEVQAKKYLSIVQEKF